MPSRTLSTWTASCAAALAARAFILAGKDQLLAFSVSGDDDHFDILSLIVIEILDVTCSQLGCGDEGADFVDESDYAALDNAVYLDLKHGLVGQHLLELVPGGIVRFGRALLVGSFQLRGVVRHGLGRLLSLCGSLFSLLRGGFDLLLGLLGNFLSLFSSLLGNFLCLLLSLFGDLFRLLGNSFGHFRSLLGSSHMQLFRLLGNGFLRSLGLLFDRFHHGLSLLCYSLLCSFDLFRDGFLHFFGLFCNSFNDLLDVHRCLPISFQTAPFMGFLRLRRFNRKTL